MSYIDLQPTLGNWTYDSDQVSVRKILGGDGSVRIQMRVELGLLQMESQGRPDGERPFGCESLLEYHRKRLARHESRNGIPLGFVLTPDHCEALRCEASMHYRRYVSLFVLEEYEAVTKDTSHSLAIFDMCRDYAFESDDRLCLESFRPYVLMMDARARAYQAMEGNDPACALAHVNRGIMHIRSHAEEYVRHDDGELGDEVKILTTLGKEIAAKIPKDSLVVTRQALRSAIEQERFEDAAKLRDVLKVRYGWVA